MKNFIPEIENAKSFEELSKLIDEMEAYIENEKASIQEKLFKRITGSDHRLDRQEAKINQFIARNAARIKDLQKQAAETNDLERRKMFLDSAQNLQDMIDSLQMSFNDLEKTAATVNKLDQMVTEIVIKPLDRVRKRLKRPRQLQVAMDILWGLVFFTLILNTWLDALSSKVASLYLIPTCLFFLQKYMLDPWFSKLSLESRKKELRYIIDASPFAFSDC